MLIFWSQIIAPMTYAVKQLSLAYDSYRMEEGRKGVSVVTINIETYGGYPELYNADGTLFTAPISRAVLRVGWVINYEQTKMLSAAVHR